LSDQFPDEEEIHHQRISLRSIEYREFVPSLFDAVVAGRRLEHATDTGLPPKGSAERSQWEPAWRLLPELRRRYEAVMGPLFANRIF
jgi:hypothetical protein